jgi:hypothetical protein
MANLQSLLTGNTNFSDPAVQQQVASLAAATGLSSSGLDSALGLQPGTAAAYLSSIGSSSESADAGSTGATADTQGNESGNATSGTSSGSGAAGTASGNNTTDTSATDSQAALNAALSTAQGLALNPATGSGIVNAPAGATQQIDNSKTSVFNAGGPNQQTNYYDSQGNPLMSVDANGNVTSTFDAQGYPLFPGSTIGDSGYGPAGGPPSGDAAGDGGGNPGFTEVDNDMYAKGGLAHLLHRYAMGGMPVSGYSAGDLIKQAANMQGTYDAANASSVPEGLYSLAQNLLPLKNTPAFMAATYTKNLNPNEDAQLATYTRQRSPAAGDMGHKGYSPPAPYMYAQGGVAPMVGHLGGYSDGGRLLRGPGDGVSDSIPATIGTHTPEPARLADGEFVVPARIVSELGNGSTEAGARALYKMMDRIQQARNKTVGKGKVATNTKASKYLPA